MGISLGNAQNAQTIDSEETSPESHAAGDAEASN